jgi:hypothetical protein
VEVLRDDRATIGAGRQLVNRKHRLKAVGQGGLAVVILLTLAGLPAGQSRGPITEARVRALARQASRDSRGDSSELVLALDQRIRAEWGDFESFPLSIVRDEELLVAVTAPYMSFRRSLVDVLRSGRPIGDAQWTGTVVVAITPRRLDAPDIESVVLSRDGRSVAPVRSELRPMTFSSGTGDERVLHAGDMHFAASAFSSGGKVVLTLAPHGRDPILYAFSDEELSSLR